MVFDRLTAGRVLARLYQLTAEKGVRLEQGRDFGHLEYLLSRQSEKRLTEHFRRDLNTYTPQQAFWLGGFNSNDELIGVAAARLDQLGPWSLERYWREYWPRCYPSNIGDAVSLSKIQYRFAKEIHGNVVYLGEMWVSSQHPRRNVSGDFAKALQILTLLEWDFDWVYAWSRPSFLERGFAEKCGFTRVHPGIRWEFGPATIDQDLKVMANSRADLFDLVEAWSFELL